MLSTPAAKQVAVQHATIAPQWMTLEEFLTSLIPSSTELSWDVVLSPSGNFARALLRKGVANYSAKLWIGKNANPKDAAMLEAEEEQHNRQQAIWHREHYIFSEEMLGQIPCLVATIHSAGYVEMLLGTLAKRQGNSSSST